MHAIAPRTPWWSVVALALLITVTLGVLHALGIGWPLRLGAVVVLVLGFAASVRRCRP